MLVFAEVILVILISYLLVCNFRIRKKRKSLNQEIEIIRKQETGVNPEKSMFKSDQSEI